MSTEATTGMRGEGQAFITDRRMLIGAALSALFLAKLAATWFFHKYDWDILEVVFLPLVHGQTVENDPYSFLLSSLLGIVGGAIGGLASFKLLMVLANLLYVASGALIFDVARQWTRNDGAAFVGAAVFLSAYCIVYVSSYLDDNVFQAFFVCVALWSLLRERPRIALAAVAYGLSCAFHLQSFALAPAFAIGVWMISPGTAGERARRLAGAVGLVVLVYGALLLLFVDIASLLSVIGGAASHGPGAFVVSRDEVGLFELLARGMVATLLPFPTHIRAAFDHASLYIPLLAGGLLYIAAVVALAGRGLSDTSGLRSGGRAWLATSLTGFGMGLLFALLAEPDGTERWVSVTPFFALMASAAVTQLRPFRSWTDAAAGRRAVGAIAAAAIVFAILPGKVLAFAALGGERQVVTSGMVEALETTLAQTDLVVLDEGFEALSLYRAARTCYTVFEYWTENLKCWGPEGVTHRDRTDRDYLDGQQTIAMQVGLPDIDAERIVVGEPVEICDPNPLSYVFGRGRCVTVRVGTVR